MSRFTMAEALGWGTLASGLLLVVTALVVLVLHS